MGQQMSHITLTISNPPGVIRVNIENEMFAKGYLMLRAKWGGRKKGQGYKYWQPGGGTEVVRSHLGSASTGTQTLV